MPPTPSQSLATYLDYSRVDYLYSELMELQRRVNDAVTYREGENSLWLHQLMSELAAKDYWTDEDYDKLDNAVRYMNAYARWHRLCWRYIEFRVLTPLPTRSPSIEEPVRAYDRTLEDNAIVRAIRLHGNVEDMEL